jgi:glycosyltransferase involved in cell wall biosynthesis
VRPLLVNTYDRGGGAAIAAMRLHRGLRGIGIESRLLVQSRHGAEPGVLGPSGGLAAAGAWARPRLDSLPARAYARRRGDLFTTAWMPDRLARDLDALAPDLVHLHWIAHGFARLESLARLTRPVVWTLHDSWAFTGGCHLPFECTRYRQACGACPALGSRAERDLSRRVFERKRAAWRDTAFTVVTPSRWLAACARSSALLGQARCEVIPNGIDLDRFRPGDRAAARARLGIASDRRVLLCGGADIARDPNKGLTLLVAALDGLPPERRATFEVLLFGTRPGDRLPASVVPMRDLGYVADEAALAQAYAAADVFVAPSLHENLPNTVLEAMACGIPCVAFDLGGLPDLIGHEREGWLARPGQADDLARGIAWVLEDEARRRSLGERARARTQAEFEIGLIARRHAALYQDVCDRARAG